MHQKNQKPAEFSPGISRDHLATDRTILANERTLLAYLRLSLTLFVAGVSFIKFFDSRILMIIGAVFIPVAIGVLLVGLRRYRRCNIFLRTLKEGNNETVLDPPRRTETERR